MSEPTPANQQFKPEPIVPQAPDKPSYPAKCSDCDGIARECVAFAATDVPLEPARPARPEITAWWCPCCGHSNSDPDVEIIQKLWPLLLPRLTGVFLGLKTEFPLEPREGKPSPTTCRYCRSAVMVENFNDALGPAWVILCTSCGWTERHGDKQAADLLLQTMMAAHGPGFENAGIRIRKQELEDGTTPEVPMEIEESKPAKKAKKPKKAKAKKPKKGAKRGSHR